MPADNPIMEPGEVFYGKSESEEPTKPTEDPVTKAEPTPQQEVEVVEKPDESETPEETEESGAEGEEEEALYVEIDGEEHNLDDVKKWRDGHLMQSDYTKKTTALADERKSFDAERKSERETLSQEKAEVTELRDQLAVLVAEDEAIDWAELREDDPDRYIELKEKADKRREALAKVKADRSTPPDDPATVQAERKKLFAANPAWVDDKGETTKTFREDIALMNEYAVSQGYDAEELNNMTKSRYLSTLLKAAKYDKLQAKGREIGKKRETVPVVPRPSAKKPTSVPKPAHEIFYGT